MRQAAEDLRECGLSWNYRVQPRHLSLGQRQQISDRIQNILDQLPAAIKQAHEGIIGGRKLRNEKKILSFYEPEIQAIKRGKSGAEVEFENNLWLGETQEGLIIDSLLEKEKTSDAKQIAPALKRLKEQQNLPLKNAWSDRGIQSDSNEKLLKKHGIYSGLCPRWVLARLEQREEVPDVSEQLPEAA